jgi:hypothetical protein
MQASNFIEKNRISDLSVKGQLEYYFMNDMHIKFGFEQKFLSGALQENWESGLVDVSKTRTHTIGYISSSYSPLENLQLEFGLRYNYFNSEADYQNIEPRLSAKYRMTETTNLKFAAGTYHQFVHRIPRLFFSSLWTSSDENVGQSESDHYILGFQKEIEFIYQLEIETYYKSYRNIYQYNQLMIADIKTEGYRDGLPMYGSTKGLFNSGEGSSYGLEVLFKRDVGSVTGWLAYSLSRTEYTFPALNHGKEYIPRHDRSSVINAVLNINVNQFLAELNDEDYEHHNDWLVSLNFIYATGQPITVPASAYFISFSPDWNIFGMNGENNPGYALYPSEIDKYRLPAYIRLDLSVTKDFDMGGWSLSPYLQIINAGNRKNLWFISYKSELIDGVLKQSIDKVNMLPLLPSIGVNFKF